MPIIEPAIRPPAEADSFLLQVTVGCSADSCTFCGVYKSKAFSVKSPKEIKADINWYACRYPGTRRVFLMDGDALVLANNKLLPILEELDKAFPRLRRISTYANGFNITKKDDSQLEELYQHKLRLIYLGLESGSQEVLNQCRKSSSVEEMVEGLNRLTKFGIKSSVIVLLGLGGKKNSKEHVQGTIEALNKMQPRYLSFLSLMVIPGTPLAKQVEKGEFQELNSDQLLKESYQIIRGLKLKKTIFRSNHASNYLPLEGTFPKDKDKLLNSLKLAFSGQKQLRPNYLRGL